MASHRCKECTLMRCDAPDQTCTECQAAAPDIIGRLSAKGEKEFLDFMKSIGGFQPNPFIYGHGAGAPQPPLAFPPGTHGPTGPASQQAQPVPTRQEVAKYLEQIGIQEAAGAVKNWLMLFDWGQSKKGVSFWSAVYNELRDISLGRTP